jgi:hypothetical protein
MNKAHFTLGVKAKVGFKSSIPIGAITEISPKGFTLGVKAGNFIYLLIYHLMALTWYQGIKRIPFNLGGQFATLKVNVATMKYCCFDEIHIIG